MSACTHIDEWVPFVEHQRLGFERSARFEEAKAENSNYLPLLDPTFKKIDEEFAQKQLAAMIALLQKCVHIRGGKTRSGSCFEGRIFVDTINRSTDTAACAHLSGCLVDDEGTVDQKQIVQIRVDTQTLLSYRK